MRKLIVWLICLFTTGGAWAAGNADPVFCYSLVLPEKPSKALAFAAEELAAGVAAATGEKLSGKPGEPFIAIGIMPPGFKEKLAPGEHVTMSDKGNIYLFGEGKWGNLYAVYAFLEDQLGCRFYDVTGKEIFAPKRPDIALPDFSRRYQFAYTYRQAGILTRHNRRFDVRNRNNISTDFTFGYASPQPGVSSDARQINGNGHTLFYLIPPLKERPNYACGWPCEGIAPYFEKNPEFFSLSADGKRVLRQLCMSNEEMRRELIKNARMVLNREKAIPGQRRELNFSANDFGGRFCYCKGCVALEKKYGCNGGPLFDCLIELAAALKDEFPDVVFTTLLYRKEQTQKPPTIPVKFPENIVGVFGPINDNFLAPLDHPDNAETYEDIKTWSKLMQLGFWYYGTHYAPTLNTSGLHAFPRRPLSMVRRTVRDMKTLRDLGCKEMFYTMGSGSPMGVSFSDLQIYLAYRLMRNPDIDAEAVIAEYIRDNYGAAAPMVKRHFEEMENARIELLKKKIHFTYAPSAGFFSSFLTPENIARWERDFAAMEKLAADDAKVLKRLRMLRLNIDIEAYSDYRGYAAAAGKNAETRAALRSRIDDTIATANRERLPDELFARLRLNARELLDELALEAKPLPREFDGISGERIIQLSPNYPNRLGGKHFIKDKDAAWGFAGIDTFPADQKTLTLQYRDYTPENASHGRQITLSDFSGGYQFYRLNRPVKLSSNCKFFFDKWRILLDADRHFNIDHPDRLYDTWFSLKFRRDKENKVKLYIDRIVLVRRPESPTADSLCFGK